MLWGETEIVIHRENVREASRALLLQMAVSTLFGGEEARTQFQLTLERLNGE